MALRAGRSLTHHLKSEEGEQLIDFLNRAVGDGWPIDLKSVIVNEGERLMLVTHEQAAQENLTGQTVKDALHVKADSDKVSDLKSLIRTAYDTFKGEPMKYDKMNIGDYDKAVTDKPEHDLQIKGEMDKRDKIQKADETKSRQRSVGRDRSTRNPRDSREDSFTPKRNFKPEFNRENLEDKEQQKQTPEKEETENGKETKESKVRD